MLFRSWDSFRQQYRFAEFDLYFAKGIDVDEILVLEAMEKSEGQIILTLSDNGAGIAEEKLPHVFEQFYRGDESRNSKKDGSGLGLYVCKYIVEQQDGSITAYNRDGFTVEIRLPQA